MGLIKGYRALAGQYIDHREANPRVSEAGGELTRLRLAHGHEWEIRPGIVTGFSAQRRGNPGDWLYATTVADLESALAERAVRPGPVGCREDPGRAP